MFECPNCNSQFSLPDYLDHARVCGGAEARNDNDATNLSNDDSIASREESTPNGPSNNSVASNDFVCPLCLQKFPMAAYAVHAPHCHLSRRADDRTSEKRPMPNNQRNESRKRPHVADGDGASASVMQIQVEQNIAPHPAYVNRDSNLHQQPPLPSFTNAPAIISTNSVQYVNGENTPNAYRQPAQSRNDLPRQEQQSINRNPTPSAQNMRAGPSPLANPVQPQYASANPSPQIVMQSANHTPMQMNPVQQPRRLKEEPAEVAANEFRPGNVNGAVGGAANLPANVLDAMNALVNAACRRVTHELRNDINEVRRRVEMFEASMMMKLGAIETAINRLKEQEDPK